MFREYYDNLIQAILPPSCVICRQATQTSEQLCQACHAELKYNRTACAQCGIPLQGASDLICGHCQIQPPAFTLSHAPFHYQGHIRELIIGLKFNEKLLNASILARLFEKFTKISELPDILIPVPLHPQRLRERGYNQARQLAEELGRHYNVPIDDQSCQRVLHTERQSDLPLAKKQGNVKGAFRCHTPYDNRHIAIVDDVMTSGHTANELAKMLKRQGTRQVDVWVMARAGKH